MLSIRKNVKKLLKDENKFKKVELGNFRGVFNLNFCGGQEKDFIANIEQIMNSGTFIKRGASTTVVKVKYAGKEIIIKRYNYQGIVHAIRHTIKGTRAQKVWKYSLYLLEAGIRTPQALAYITTKFYGINRESYIINEYIDAPTLGQLIQQNIINNKTPKLVRNFCDKLTLTFKKLKISHNDLKPSNILIKDNKAYLIDLDGMQLHNLNLHFMHRHSKDVNSLTRRILTPTVAANKPQQPPHPPQISL